MIAKSNAASIFLGTQGSRSIEISVPGAFTAGGFSGQQKNPGASAAERGRPSLFKTIDEDRRQRHDHINRSDRSTYPGRISVLTSGATSDSFTAAGQKVRTTIADVRDRVVSYTEDNPVNAILISAAVGALVATFVHALKRD